MLIGTFFKINCKIQLKCYYNASVVSDFKYLLYKFYVNLLHHKIYLYLCFLKHFYNYFAMIDQPMGSRSVACLEI